MTKKKNLKVFINFDEKNYSKEETIFLYQRFYEILAEAKNIKVPKNLGNTLYKCFLEKNKDH